MFKSRRGQKFFFDTFLLLLVPLCIFLNFEVNLINLTLNFFRYATILAFDVKIERDAQDLADSLGVKIFQADIIYHLFDKFTAYREELKQQKRDQFKSIAVFPCKLKVINYFRCKCSLSFLFIFFVVH